MSGSVIEWTRMGATWGDMGHGQPDRTLFELFGKLAVLYVVEYCKGSQQYYDMNSSGRRKSLSFSLSHVPCPTTRPVLARERANPPRSFHCPAPPHRTKARGKGAGAVQRGRVSHELLSII